MNDIGLDPAMYDNTHGYDDETDIRFAEGLSENERKHATLLYRLFNELWGVCIIKGDPGSGKDLLGNYLSYNIKRYFPHKRILRDEKPRLLFGKYDGLFNDKILHEDLERMKSLARGDEARQTLKEYDNKLEKAVNIWMSETGEVLLKNSVLYLTEYKRYCYNREPHNPMNKTMGAVHEGKRHLDCLVLGTVQLPKELDKFTCLPWVDWQVTCTRSMNNPTRFVYLVHKVKYDRRLDVLDILGRPYPIPIDAAKPRSFIGDGKIRLRKPKYLPETEEERIILDVIKAGYDTYDSIVELLYDEGDMDEDEVLMTLKDLSFRKRKRVLDYPCYWRIYNSKSPLQI